MAIHVNNFKRFQLAEEAESRLNSLVACPTVEFFDSHYPGLESRLSYHPDITELKIRKRLLAYIKPPSIQYVSFLLVSNVDGVRYYIGLRKIGSVAFVPHVGIDICESQIEKK